MEPSPTDGQQPLDKTTAYVTGSLPPEEVAEFEKRMVADAALRRDVEACRETFTAVDDWLHEDPPGKDSVLGLEIPRVAGNKIVDMPRGSDSASRMYVFLRRGLVAAALFAAGFAMGMAFQDGSDGHAPETDPGSDRITQEGTADPSDPVTPQATPLPDKKSAPPMHGGSTHLAHTRADPQPAYTIERDGRILIESQHQETGVRALWVVDGSFQLSDSPPAGEGDES